MQTGQAHMYQDQTLFMPAACPPQQSLTSSEHVEGAAQVRVARLTTPLIHTSKRFGLLGSLSVLGLLGLRHGQVSGAEVGARLSLGLDVAQLASDVQLRVQQAHCLRKLAHHSLHD